MIDQNEASRRRRIIAQGLKPHVSAAAMLTGVKLCDKEFQSENVFSVQRFLDRLSQLETEVSANKGVIFKTLLNLRQIDPTLLGPDPLADGSSRSTAPPATRNMPLPAAASSSGKSTVAVGWSRMFQHLLKTLIATLRNQDEIRIAHLMDGLSKEAKGFKMSPASIQNLHEWIGSKFTAPLNATSMNLDEMQLLLHTIYVWCCEEFGPVASDRMLGRVLRECEALPDAVHYPPQTFL